MTIAEIHGKISETGTNLSERMEDLLTSNIFGCMRYLPAEKALVPFLNLGKSFHGNTFTCPDNISAIHYAFWPWLVMPDRIPCEPDLVIGLEIEDNSLYLVMVEAKYYSGLSSEEDERAEPNDQLARELDNLDAISSVHLGWKPELNIVSRTLLFVTQQMGLPRELLARSLDEYRRKRKREGDIFWLSWRFLSRILENSLKNESNPAYNAVLGDTLELLLRKGLEMFDGIEPIKHYFDIHGFYHIAARIYSWPSIPKPLNIGYQFGR